MPPPRARRDTSRGSGTIGRPERAATMPALLDRCRRGLAMAAGAYLTLLPSNAISFWRSLAFAVAAIAAIALVTATARRRAAPLPSPGRAIVIALVAWAAWACASLAWSTDPTYTAGELKSDVLWGLVTMLVFYVAAVLGDARALFAAALAGLAFWPALAVGFALSPAGWNARLAHMGVVAYSTYLVTVAPLLLLLAWRPPLGWGTSARAGAVALIVFALVVVTARMSDNRIVWLALAAALIVVSIVLRKAASRRVAIAALAAALAFGALFADAMRERAEDVYPPRTTIEHTLANDPRLTIWRHASEHFRARPWLGHGYGRLILQDELRADTGDRLLTHAHNMFVSQALQTGSIGLALLVALLGALAARYVGMARSGDETLRRYAAVGLAVLAAFVVKNLSDDFFFRANAKLFFAVHATLLGAAVLRERVSADAARATAPAHGRRPGPPSGSA